MIHQSDDIVCHLKNRVIVFRARAFAATAIIKNGDGIVFFKLLDYWLPIEVVKSVAANKNKIIGTLGAAYVGKMLAKSFGNGQLAKLGPIRIKA